VQSASWLAFLPLAHFFLAGFPPFYSAYVGGLGQGACLFFFRVNFPSFGIGHYVFWFGFQLLGLGLGLLAIGLSSSSPLFM
jgi:hypothetical protein